MPAKIKNSLVFLCSEDSKRAFSFTWLVVMQIYCYKRKYLHKKRVQVPGLLWDNNKAAVSLFWSTNVAAVTPCENAL